MALPTPIRQTTSTRFGEQVTEPMAMDNPTQCPQCPQVAQLQASQWNTLLSRMQSIGDHQGTNVTTADSGQ